MNDYFNTIVKSEPISNLPAFCKNCSTSSGLSWYIDSESFGSHSLGDWDESLADVELELNINKIINFYFFILKCNNALPLIKYICYYYITTMGKVLAWKEISSKGTAMSET